MRDLIERLERAEGPRFDLWVDAWHSAKTKRMTHARDRFISLVMANAYFDAAMMLLPAGYDWMITTGSHIGGSHAHCCPEGPDSQGVADPRTRHCYHASPATALIVASLKAREAGNG